MADADLTVGLEGAAGVKSALSDIALTGANAFQQLATAVESGNFAGVAELIGGPYAGALVAVVQTIYNFTRAHAEAVVELNALAEQAGTTVNRMRGLQELFATAGVGAEQFSRTMARLATRLALQGPAIAQSVRDSAATEEGANLRIIASVEAVAEAKQRASEQGTHAAEQAQEDSLTHQSDLLNEATAQQHLLDILSGSPNKEANKLLDLQKAMQAVPEAQAKTARDNIAAAEHSEDADLAAKKNATEILEAQNNAVKASNAAYDEMTRDIKLVAEALNGLGPLVGKLGDVSTQVISKATQLNAANAANVSPTNVTTDQFKDEIAKVFHSGLLSAAQMGGIAQQDLGGRGSAATAQIVQLFSQGPEKMNASIDKFVASSAQLSGADVKAATDLVEAAHKFDAQASSFGDKAATSFIQVMQQAGRGLVGRASGGPVSGPGTGTSDTAGLFALSHGEFVVRAASVQKYGIDLFNALNGLEFPGMAMGGLVQPIRMAGGGKVPSSSVLNLSIDGTHFDGLRAPENVADKIKTYAINRQTAQTGKKPSWVR